MVATYLIGTGEAQPVQHWNENIGWNEEAQNVSTSYEPILSAMGVDFSWYAYDGHSRLEWGDEGQWNRKTSHAPVRHQELLCSPLASTGQGVVHAYTQRGSQQDCKYHIVCGREVLLVRRVHLAGSNEWLFLPWSNTQMDGKHLRSHPPVLGVCWPWKRKHWSFTPL